MLSMLVSLVLAAPQQGDEELSVEGPTPSVVRLGAQCRVDVKVSGAKANPRPPVVPAVDGLSIRVSAPQQQSFTTMIGGRVYAERSVTYVLSITPDRVGKFELPPIAIWTGSREQRTPVLRFEVVKDIRGQDRGFLSIEVEPERVYVNEPVRFLIDYGVDAGLDLASGRLRDGSEYYEVEIQAPWLEQMDGAIAIESSASKPRTPVNLILNGHAESVEYTANHDRDGRRFHLFHLERSFLPTRAGRLELPAPVLRYAARLGPVRRDLFGMPIGARSEEFFAYGDPVVIEVVPLPETGRPASYSGAVGRFELSAKVDKARVRVGNSVQLTLSITGPGNSEFLGVPELGPLAGLHELGRKENRAAGRVDVTYDLTPLHAEVAAIPAIRWSYFDTTPGVERYVEVETQPIPLHVEPLPEGEALTELPGTAPAAVTPGVDDIYDIKALDTGRPLRRERFGGAWQRAAWFAAPWLLCALIALGLRRHRARSADVAGRRARAARQVFRRELAAGRALDALVAYLAARLGVPEAAVIEPDLAGRLMRAGVDAELAADAQRAIERGVAGSYGGAAPLDPDTTSALVDRLERVDVARERGAFARSVLAVLCCGVLAHGSLAAQDGAGAEAYRAGDYAAAAEAWSRAAAEPDPDRRVLFNLGNALFRLGRLPEALVAWERARLAMPRDPELLSNLRLVRQRLDVGGDDSFLHAVGALRDSTTVPERLWLCALCNALAALALVFGRRALRWLGALLLLPALLLAAEVLWLGPARAPRGIVTERRVDVVAEPRAGLDAVVKLRGGAEVDVLSAGPEWTLVRAGGRSGYVPSRAIGVIE